jgi:hypothetical protein
MSTNGNAFPILSYVILDPVTITSRKPSARTRVMRATLAGLMQRAELRLRAMKVLLACLENAETLLMETFPFQRNAEIRACSALIQRMERVFQQDIAMAH